MRTVAGFTICAAAGWCWLHGFSFLIAAAELAVLALTFVYWALIPRQNVPRHRVRHHRIRVRLHLHPGRGHATAFELWLRWGRLASFRESSRTRPGLGFAERAFHSEVHSILLGRAHYGMRLRADMQTHVIVISPPRKGKSAWLARVISHYPGPVVSATTRADIFDLTSGLRARRGFVHVFNPMNIGFVPSTFRWNPLEGCQDPATAIRRADMFTQSVSQKGVDDGTFWSQMAGEWLRAMFQAAALGGLTMLHVQAWTLTGNAQQAENILTAHGRREAAASLAQMHFDAKKTTQTIQMTLARALSFLADPMLAASVLPAEGDGLDIEAFLLGSGTLYMIAESRNQESPLAPLFACLANEIHYEAALLGSQSDGGRLDPPLLMALDEVTQICPIPLPSWLADSGGKGIQIIAVCHGEAQLRSRWGADGARVIFDTSGVKLYLPGITDPATLDTASKLCGETAYREHGEAEKYSRHPVMTMDMVSRLPKWRALAIYGGHAPVIVKLGRAWKDPAYRWAKWHGNAVAVVQAAAETPAMINRPVFGAVVPDIPASALEPEAADATSPAEAPELEPVSVEPNGAYPWQR